MTHFGRAVVVACCTVIVLAVLAVLAVPAVSADETVPAVSSSNSTQTQIGTPAPELKFGGCRVRCLGNYTTAISGGPSAWGMEASCTAATSHFQGDAFAQADNACYNMGYDGACLVTYVVTTGCYTNSMGQIQIDGYANFKCTTEICIDPLQPQ